MHSDISADTQVTQAAANSDALRSMDEFKKGLQQRLQDHEQELKAEKSKQAGASSKHHLQQLLLSMSALSLTQHSCGSLPPLPQHFSAFPLPELLASRTTVSSSS